MNFVRFLNKNRILLIVQLNRKCAHNHLRKRRSKFETCVMYILHQKTCKKKKRFVDRHFSRALNSWGCFCFTHFCACESLYFLASRKKKTLVLVMPLKSSLQSVTRNSDNRYTPLLGKKIFPPFFLTDVKNIINAPQTGLPARRKHVCQKSFFFFTTPLFR